MERTLKYTCILAIIIVLCSLYRPKIADFKFSETQFYITIVPTSFWNLSRANLCYRVWGRYIEELFPHSKFNFAFCRRINISGTITIMSHICQDAFLFPFKSAMLDFMNNTDLHWFIRTTDDVYVGLSQIAKLIGDLEKQYNPLQDIVVKGNALVTGDWFFLHGGSGWIMSRAAVEKLLSLEKIKPFNDRETDDTQIVYYFKLMGIDATNSDSLSIIGTPINKSQKFEVLHKENYNELHCCPKDKPLTNAREISIWHCGDLELSALLYGDRFQKRAPNGTWIYNSYSSTKFCKYC